MTTQSAKDEYGAYRWNGVIDVGYEHKTFKIVFGVCGGICAMFVVMSLIMGGEMLKVTLLSCIGAMAVAGGTCWLYKQNAGKRVQGYMMTEEVISLKQRRYWAPFSFQSIKKAVIYPSRDMIELYQIARSAPIFVPHEDFEFVKDFILERIPETAEVKYE